MSELMTVVRYVLPNGKEPFTEWIRRLKDRTARARILVKIDRLAMGSVSNVKSLGEGVNELKLTIGHGYRVYFGYDGTSVIVLLAGGDKSTQSDDVKKAKEYWHEYKKDKRS
ncbi:MAG: type II toxin-antitoxin system RelE/ParE family toxin [Deltaproteobacteria bacterium]